jgi:hypothetical protein
VTRVVQTRNVLTNSFFFEKKRYAFGIILHFLITGELYPFAPPKDEETGRIDVSALFRHGAGRSETRVAAGEERKREGEGVFCKCLMVVLQHKLQCPGSLRALCEKCWAAAPDARPEFEQILKTLNSDS